MKKIILSILLVGILLTGTPIVKANTIQDNVIKANPQQIEEVLKQQLIDLLTQMIAVLQEQLKVMIAQQKVLEETKVNQQNNYIYEVIPQASSTIVEPVIPVEVSFDKIPAWVSERQVGGFGINNVERGDKITISHNGLNKSEVVEKTSGKHKLYWVVFPEGFTYPVELTLLRDDKFAKQIVNE